MDKNSVRPMRVKKAQWQWLWSFLSEYKSWIFGITFGFFVLTIIEISIPILAKNHLSQTLGMLDLTEWRLLFKVLLLLLVAYAITSFLSHYAEKFLVTRFMNTLRSMHYIKLLRKKRTPATPDIARFFNNVTYHFGLLQMGISSALAPFIRWTFLTFLLLITAAFINQTMLALVIIGTLFGIILMTIGHLIAKKHVSQNQTLYNKLMLHAGNSLMSDQSHNDVSAQQQRFDEFWRITKIDEFWRVRRMLTIEMSQSLLFLIITLGAAGGAYILLTMPWLTEQVDGQKILLGIMTAFLLHQLYRSLRIGLYAFPLYLGLVLCLPENTQASKPRSHTKHPKKLVFRSQKIMLPGIKRMDAEVEIIAGKKYYIHADNSMLERSIEELLTGNLSNGDRNKWKVVVDGKRQKFAHWITRNNYCISILPRLQGSETVLEFLSGGNINDIETITKYAEKLQIWRNVFPRFFENVSIWQKEVGRLMPHEQVIIQMCKALIHPPFMVVLQPNLYPQNIEIKKALEIFEQNSSTTSIVQIGGEKMQNLTEISLKKGEE